MKLWLCWQASQTLFHSKQICISVSGVYCNIDYCKMLPGNFATWDLMTKVLDHGNSLKVLLSNQVLRFKAKWTCRGQVADTAKNSKGKTIGLESVEHHYCPEVHFYVQQGSDTFCWHIFFITVFVVLATLTNKWKKELVHVQTILQTSVKSSLIYIYYVKIGCKYSTAEICVKHVSMPGSSYVV